MKFHKNQKKQTEKRNKKFRKHALKQVAKRLSPETTNDEKQNVVTAWQELRSYMNSNPQLRSVHQGRFEPKTQLEKEIEEAIKISDHTKAGELNDKLCAKNMAREIVRAIACKRYAEEKQHDEDSLIAKKKPRLNWGFDSKERWERKGNM